jgi:phenylacetate-coenzyme A ligase PaaK-like adenylate-forming protein
MPEFAGMLRATAQYPLMLRSQYWSAATLSSFVQRHIAATLEAALRLPFYRARFGPLDTRRCELKDLPMLPRREVPELAASVRASYPDAPLLSTGVTSGSTGNPVAFFFDAAHQASRFAARARYLRENGWNPFQRSLWIVSISMETPDLAFTQHQKIFGIRFLGHLLDMQHLADELRKTDPVFLYAYPVNLDGLARIFEARGDHLRRLRKIFSGSEEKRSEYGRPFSASKVRQFLSTVQAS